MPFIFLLLSSIVIGADVNTSCETTCDVDSMQYWECDRLTSHGIRTSIIEICGNELSIIDVPTHANAGIIRLMKGKIEDHNQQLYFNPDTTLIFSANFVHCTSASINCDNTVQLNFFDHETSLYISRTFLKSARVVNSELVEKYTSKKELYHHVPHPSVNMNCIKRMNWRRQVDEHRIDYCNY